MAAPNVVIVKPAADDFEKKSAGSCKPRPWKGQNAFQITSVENIATDPTPELKHSAPHPFIVKQNPYAVTLLAGGAMYWRGATSV